MSYAERVRALAKNAQRSGGIPIEKQSGKYELMKEKTIKKLFEYVKERATSRIDKRAIEGYMTAIVFDYPFMGGMYINKNDDVIFTERVERIEWEYVFRTHDIVKCDQFQKLLTDFFVHESGMHVKCYFPRADNITNIIEVCWGTKDDYLPQMWIETIRINEEKKREADHFLNQLSSEYHYDKNIYTIPEYSEKKKRERSRSPSRRDEKRSKRSSDYLDRSLDDYYSRR